MSTFLDFTDWDDDRTPQFEDFHVQQIPRELAERFVAEHHYSGGLGNAPMSWGLYDQHTGRLIGAIAFHTPISEAARASVFEQTDEGSYQLPADGPIPEKKRCDCSHISKEHAPREHVTELHRLAIVPEAPKNTATWFISRALDRLKEYKPKYWAVISFADTTEGHDGTVYQAANADYYGMSDAKVFYEDQSGRLRNPRQCGENITTEQAQERGWTPVQRDTKHRYVFWLPDPYGSKEELRERSEIELQPYPTTEEEQ